MKSMSQESKRAARLVLLTFLVFLMSSEGVALQSTVQDADKSLDIERFADEPLEMVELKIGTQSLKDRIATKFPRQNGVGIDTISFKERDGWFRQLQVKLRNVTSKPIYGVRAHLYFRPSGSDTLYSLPITGFTQLGQGVVEPGAEITLVVTEQAWTLTADILKTHSVNPDLVPVSFGIDVVQFDDLQWSKGRMLRKDPQNPNRWITSDKVVPRSP